MRSTGKQTSPFTLSTKDLFTLLIKNWGIISYQNEYDFFSATGFPHVILLFIYFFLFVSHQEQCNFGYKQQVLEIASWMLYFQAMTIRRG